MKWKDMHVTSMGHWVYIMIMCLFMHVLMDVCEIYHIIDLSFIIAYIVSHLWYSHVILDNVWRSQSVPLCLFPMSLDYMF